MAHSIVVRCPNCSQKYRLSPDKIGSKARCKCGQRFTIASETPLDEDTVFGWVVQGADPSSRSVLGGTSIMNSPTSQNQEVAQARSSKPKPKAAVRAQPRVKLEQIDEFGAQFEFPAATLSKERLRDSFPKKCVSCGRSQKLNVHLIVWNKKLPADDPLRIRDISHQPIGRLQSLAGHGSESWLAGLPNLKNLPEPYNLPFPFFVCNDCTAEDDIVCSLFTTQNVELCRICVANLRIAVAFYRNNAGADTPLYARLLRERETQKQDRWKSLPGSVRRKISQWYERQEREEFRGFFPDADFSEAEMGKAGVVLTSRHLSFHKYSTSREFSLSKGGKVFLESDRDSTTLRIVQRGRKDAAVNLRPALAEKLVSELQRSGQQWTVAGRP